MGALAGVTNLARPNFLDKIRERHFGSVGDRFPTSKQSRQIITTSDNRRAMEILPSPGANPMVDLFMQGYEGSHVGHTPLGVEVLGSARSVPVAGWCAVALLPTAEAFAPIHAMQQHILQVAVLSPWWREAWSG